MAEDDQATPQPEESGAEETQPSAEESAPKSPKEQQAADALAAAQAALNQLKNEASDPPGDAEGDGVAASTPEQDATPPASDGSARFDPPSFSLGASSELPEGLALLKDVNLDVKIELGRTRMVVDDVLRLSEGAVVELDKLAGDPVDIYVNGRHIARGEVLVLNDNFCVRISEILAGAEAAAQQIASAAADSMSA
ncbi:MAG: flagellar motor switch protein FliN [Phycisphaerales bacterium JB065]